MRVTAFILAAAFVVAAGSAMACPMQSAANAPAIASSNTNSTPIPAKAQPPNNG